MTEGTMRRWSHESSSRCSWQPLLPRDEATRARDVVDGIVESLLVPPNALLNLDLGALSVSLCNGTAGLAMALSHLAPQYPGRGLEDAALSCLEHALEGCSDQQTQPSLYNGFLGVAWVAEHLDGVLFECEGDPNSEVEERLLELVARSPWRAAVELIEGLAGFGLFAVDRHRRHGNATAVRLILDRLEEVAEASSQGITWFTPPEQLARAFGEVAPHGYYNLGVSHGVPGVIGFLLASHRAGIERARCAHLMTESTRWLLAQRLDGERDARFSHAILVGMESHVARTSWCYGDLGISLVLLGVARALGRSEWESDAVELAKLAARRQLENTGVVDACLCHGSAGNAHLFNRLFQATGEPLFAEAALRWYRDALARHLPGQGIGGFLTWSGDGSGRRDWNGLPGFLIGAAGIALALAAGYSSSEPSWDRVLLADLPPSCARNGVEEQE